MTLLQLIACVGMTAGAVLLFRISPMEFTDGLFCFLTRKPKIQNDVFHEWCDAISACQYDRNLKTTLTPIVNKLSDMRTVNAELDYLVAEPRKEFAMMVMLVVGNIPILYFLNKDWYAALMFSPVGQIMLAVCAAAIFFSVARVIRLTKPIEYKR